MNIGLPELSIIGVVALLFLGGAKLRSGSRKPRKLTGQKLDPNANFQRMNTEYDNVSILEEESSKKT